MPAPVGGPGSSVEGTSELGMVRTPDRWTTGMPSRLGMPLFTGTTAAAEEPRREGDGKNAAPSAVPLRPCAWTWGLGPACDWGLLPPELGLLLGTLGAGKGGMPILDACLLLGPALWPVRWGEMGLEPGREVGREAGRLELAAPVSDQAWERVVAECRRMCCEAAGQGNTRKHEPSLPQMM